MGWRTWLLLGAVACTFASSDEGPERGAPARPSGSKIVLEAARTDGPLSVEAALARRRSVRTFADQGLTVQQIGQLLWAAQGVTEPARGLRAAPSAGALYPIEVDVIAVGTAGLADGVYRYVPSEHALVQRRSGDLRADVRAGALDQDALAQAPLILALWGVESRTAARYGPRARSFVLLEAGHAAQNVLLQAVALDLASVPIGAFDADQLRRTLGAGRDEELLYLLPIGPAAR